MTQFFYSWIHSITWIRLSDEKKAEISVEINEESRATGLFWLELIISSLIATLGLLQNSSAVIIGAMLIAPLLQPIQGLALGISLGRPAKMWHGAKLLLLSSVFAIVAAWVFTLLVPFQLETTEISARTAPNLLDLIIAIASAVIALLALSYPRLSQSIAGVAMSTALLPPLSVIGIELAFGQYSAASGALLLYMTNLFAILSVGVVMFLLYGFYPHQKETQSQSIKSTSVLMVLLLLISLPLIASLTRISDQIYLQSEARTVFNTHLNNYLPGARLKELKLLQFDSARAHFLVQITIPQNTEFYQETQDLFKKQLNNRLERETNVDIEVIPIASIISQSEAEALQTPSKETQIKEIIRETLNSKVSQMTLIDLNLAQVANTTESGETNLNSPAKWTVKTTFSLPPGNQFNEELKIQLEQTLLKQLDSQFTSTEPFQFLWVFLPAAAAQQRENMSREEKFLEALTLEWESYINTVKPESSSIEKLRINWEKKTENTAENLENLKTQISSLSLSFDIFYASDTQNKLSRFRRDLRQFARQQFSVPVYINTRQFMFTENSISSNTQNKTDENLEKLNELEKPVESTITPSSLDL